MNQEQLLTRIKSLKRKLNIYKRKSELLDLVEEINPEECGYPLKVDTTRDYLKRAIQAYEEIGGTYSPTRKEIKSADFQKNIKNIKTISYNIHTTKARNSYTLEISNKDIIERHTCLSYHIDHVIDGDEELTKKFVMSKLKSLYMGEWKSFYDSTQYGYYILDGTSWDITIEYKTNHKPVIFSEVNAFPYNFWEFEDLFVNDHSPVEASTLS